MKRCVMYGLLLLSCCAICCTKQLGSMEEVKTAEVSEVNLNQLAQIFSNLPLDVEQVVEVHDAVSSSSRNGYDEEYLMKDLLEMPGRGVGAKKLQQLSAKAGDGSYLSSPLVKSEKIYKRPLKDLLASYLNRTATKCAACPSVLTPAQFLDLLSRSQTQIYWPYSERWDGKTLPIITFDPCNGDVSNIGYRLAGEGEERQVEEVMVTEELASEVPVWVINLNEDSDFTSIEVHRHADPNWGTGGGSVTVEPGCCTREVSDPQNPVLKTLRIKEFTAMRNYDTWFAGASEFFLKCGSVEEFTASTEEELQLFNPIITDFMVVVRRNEIGIPKPLNTVLISDMSPQLVNSAFMMIEDDGGKRMKWDCEAVVKIRSKSYGFVVSIPYNSRDDIVWRGSLSTKYFWNRSNAAENFGDVRLTFEIMEEGVQPISQEF